MREGQGRVRQVVRERSTSAASHAADAPFAYHVYRSLAAMEGREGRRAAASRCRMQRAPPSLRPVAFRPRHAQNRGKPASPVQAPRSASHPAATVSGTATLCRAPNAARVTRGETWRRARKKTLCYGAACTSGFTRHVPYLEAPRTTSSRTSTANRQMGNRNRIQVVAARVGEDNPFQRAPRQP